MKAKLKSVAVLVVIALTSAVLLTLANHFLPPAPMTVDAAMKQTIYDISGSKDISALDLDLSSETDSDGDQLVVFVFKINDGANKDSYVVFSRGLGFSQGGKAFITLAVMIKSNTVTAVKLYDNGAPGNDRVVNDNYSEAFTNLIEKAFIGYTADTSVVPGEAISSATISTNGIKAAVKTAVNYIAKNSATVASAAESSVDMSEVKTGGDGPEVPTGVDSQELTNKMKTELGKLGYDVNTLEAQQLIYPDKIKASHVHGAYKITTGDNAGNIIIIGKASGDYGESIIMAVEVNATVSVAVNYIQITDDFDNIHDGSHDATDYREAILAVDYNALWAGKTSSQVLRDDVRAIGEVDTLATLTSTPAAVAKAVQNALKVFEYADNISIWFAEA